MPGNLVGLVQRTFGYFIFYYTLIVNRTTTWSYSGQEFLESAEDHKKVILASWHEFYLMFLAYMHSGQGANISCLALGGPKGEGFSTIASRFGALIHYTSPNGDKEVNRGAVQGVIDDMRVLNRDTFIMLDGPAGPARKAKFGVSKLATDSDGVVLPVTMKINRALRLPRWDSMVIPLPFSRIHLSFGQPVVAKGKEKPAILAAVVNAIEACTTASSAASTI